MTTILSSVFFFWVILRASIRLKCLERERDRQTDRQTDTDTDRETDRERQRQTDRHRERKRDRDKQRETQREKERLYDDHGKDHLFFLILFYDQYHNGTAYDS